MKTWSLIFLISGFIVAWIPVIRHWKGNQRSSNVASALDDTFYDGWISFVFDFIRAIADTRMDRILGLIAVALIFVGVVIELT
ncbi:MAG: hypothetical protein KJT03_21870 [Verrucomicrobiae bacterium]|nr:hypothetical protein [Verrucomicrobiae bacterium]